LRDVVKVPALAPGNTSVWAQYTIVTDPRDALARACREAGVPTAIHYVSALHTLPSYRQFPTAPGGIPVAESLQSRVISLPMHPYLDEEAQDFIIETVRAALAKAGAREAAE
jgi:dTDP-4-amino-4,6-dideoxygalactose transaminase